jgi:hypothetical protein
MRVVRVLAVLVATTAFLAAPATGLAANRYVTYVACSTSKQAPAATSCRKSSAKAAFFKSRDASVSYKVCVKFPNGAKLCSSAQAAPQGTKHVNQITSTMKGTHHVTWTVGAKQVGSWDFVVTN